MIVWLLMVTTFTDANLEQRWIYSTHEVLSECFELKRTAFPIDRWKPGVEIHCVAAGEV